MWSYVNDRIRLDISKIRDDFKIIHQDNLHFIHPKKNLWDWNEDERWLRSLIVDENGFVVSTGWKKFFNYGENLADTKLFNDNINDVNIKFSQKEDGSLCIRSVINGKVVFRTRGTIYGEWGEEEEPYKDRFIKVAKGKYSVLLDETFATDKSLLFEYVAPTNKIVINYDEEDLIFLGFIYHNNLQISEWDEIKEFANRHKLNIVKQFDLPREPIKLLEEIKNWKIEGIVIRYKQLFLKIKSDYYKELFKMKFSINYKFIAEFCITANIQTEKKLISKFQELDYDWEIIEFAKQYYYRYTDAVKYTEQLKNYAVLFVNNFHSDESDKIKRRKEFAEYVFKNSNKFERPIIFSTYSGDEKEVKNICNKLIVNEYGKETY